MKIFCLAALVSTSTAVNNIPTSGYVGCISGMNTAYITSEWKYGGGNDATPWTITGYDELNYPSGFTCENGAGAPCTYPSDSSLSSKYMDYWNQCRDNCQSEGNGYEFFSLACGKECRCFNAAALPQSKNDVGTGFDSSGSPNWGYGKANNKWYPMNQCSSKWNNDWCGRPAAFEFGGRTYLNGGSGRAAIYCANPDGCTAPDSYVPSNTPNPTTTTTTTTTTATGTTTSTSTMSTAPTYTHGSVPSGGGSFGSSACPIMCKSDGKTLQVFHSTIHGTGLDDTSVHSPSNVMPHSCMHNKDTNKCECTCTSAQDATTTTSTPAPTTTTTTTTPAAPAFQENIGGCCSGRNELGNLGLGYGGSGTRSQRIEECKAMCASRADCVSFEAHPGGPNRPESEIPNCDFSLTCKANEYPGGGCGHDLYIKQ